MVAVRYQDLALDWQIADTEKRTFNRITIISLVVTTVFAVIVANIQVPEPERVAETVVPERVAQFVLERERAKPPPPPKPQQVKPLPKPQPKPKVRKEAPKEAEKPLTKEQAVAREKAEKSGLLALGSELADLIDTSDVSAMVSGDVSKTSSAAEQAAGHDSSVLTAGAGQGSGGVDAAGYGVTVAGTQLSERERAQLRQVILAGGAAAAVEEESAERGANLRAEEEVTMVFDQNKSKLYSVYNRARRKNPGLKGKVVLEIVIEPNGKVANVRIISSELNDPTFESSLIARIKMFNFGDSNTETLTVTYPIEFLPS